MFLFIDTNVFLSFYHLTDDDIQELKKLVHLIEQREITLLLPQQTIDETWRNRANKIEDGLKGPKRAKFNIGYPAYCKNYEKFSELKECEKKLSELHKQLLNQVEHDINNQQLAADNLLKSLFDQAKIIERTSDIMEKARSRVEIGNPPGKKGELGDAIIWESLLQYFDIGPSVNRGPSIHFVAGDKDFCSPQNNSIFNEFLESEWKQKYNSSIHFYNKLSGFFSFKFPHIDLETEKEKDRLILDLVNSGNFRDTHIIISKLKNYERFTAQQAENLILAAISNSQVEWIINDDDVLEFYNDLYNRYELDLIFTEHWDDFKRLMDSANENTDDIDGEGEIPF